MLSRLEQVAEKGLPFVALILFIAFLAEVLYKPIGWLIIPIFIFAPYYILYDVFIRKE